MSLQGFWNLSLTLLECFCDWIPKHQLRCIRGDLKWSLAIACVGLVVSAPKPSLGVVCLASSFLSMAPMTQVLQVTFVFDILTRSRLASSMGSLRAPGQRT